MATALAPRPTDDVTRVVGELRALGATNDDLASWERQWSSLLDAARAEGRAGMLVAGCLELVRDVQAAGGL